MLRILFFPTILLAFAILVSVSGEAQGVGYTGSISGSVLLGDVAKPARFATVRVTGNVSSQTVLADYDGHFTISQLAVGEYIVDATYSGYIDPIQQRNPQDMSPLIRRSLGSREQDIADVLVAAGRVSMATIVLTHGASISGSVVYDDGGSAPQVRLEAIKLPSHDGRNVNTQSGSTVGSIMASVETDNRGNFLLSGLPEGQYALRATVPFHGLRSWYFGDTPDAQRAMEIHLVEGGDFQGVVIHLPATVDPLLPSK